MSMYFLYRLVLVTVISVDYIYLNCYIMLVDASFSSPAKSEEKNGLSGLSKKELCDLYEQIMNCEDSDNLQKVVDIIENTGLYKVSEKTFEFDLCYLEKATLRKIQKCLASR